MHAQLFKARSLKKKSQTNNSNSLGVWVLVLYLKALFTPFSRLGQYMEAGDRTVHLGTLISMDCSTIAPVCTNQGLGTITLYEHVSSDSSVSSSIHLLWFLELHHFYPPIVTVPASPTSSSLSQTRNYQMNLNTLQMVLLTWSLQILSNQCIPDKQVQIQFSQFKSKSGQTLHIFIWRKHRRHRETWMYKQRRPGRLASKQELL